MALEPLSTKYASGFPTARQLSVFFDNRVGQLLRLTRLFDDTDIHILGLSVVNSMDCAIIRMIVDDPDQAHDLLTNAGFAVNPTDILVVELPPGKRALLHTWVVFMSAEVNVAYAYALLSQPDKPPAIAVQADSLEGAAKALTEKGFTVLDQTDLRGWHGLS
jgi:hypothetical protein